MPPINPDDPGGSELGEYPISAADADNTSAAAGFAVDGKTANKDGSTGNIRIFPGPGSAGSPFVLPPGSSLYGIFASLVNPSIIRKGS